MDKIYLQKIVTEQRKDFLQSQDLIDREVLENIDQTIDLPHIIVFTGVRRCGKSSCMQLIAKKMLKKDADAAVFYFNFDDERLINFTYKDFDLLLEIFYSQENVLQQTKHYFFFDEIQDVEHIDKFLNRLQRNKKNKIFVSGSNANLLSKEISTLLTGRNLAIEVSPFSFKEFLQFHSVEYSKDLVFTTEQEAIIQKYFDKYLASGGFPERVKADTSSILVNYYDDIINKDIIVRHKVKNIKAIKELGFYAMSNISNLFSYKRLNDLFPTIKSTNTIIQYIEYLSDAYLFFLVKNFDFSIRAQIKSQPKLYSIDNGMFSAIGRYILDNKDVLLENLVYLVLRKMYGEEVYYSKNSKFDIDFVARKKFSVDKLVQVSLSLADRSTKDREITALKKAMQAFDMKDGFVITLDEEEVIELEGGKKIYIVPAFKFML